MFREKLQKIDAVVGKVGIFFLYFFLIYLPFYEIILHALESKTRLSTGMVFWICHFYEPILLLLLLYYIGKLVIIKGFKKLEKSDMYIGLFILLAIILAVLRPDQLSRGFEGLRFLVLPFAIYLIARFSNYKNPKALITIYLVIAIVMSAIGVFEYFFLTPAYWAGYLGISGFGFGQNSLIATSQATALFVGPNQLASYLLLAFFYLIHRFFTSKRPIYLDYENIFLLIVILAIGLTYSRSALIGLIISVVWMFIYFRKSISGKIIQTILFITVAITTAVVFAMYNGELLRDILTHGSSFTAHLNATKDSIIRLKDSGIVALFFGAGVGSAGPTALKIGGIISENYYLQVIFETGIVGFMLFALFVAEILKTLFRGSKTMFFAFIALLINALFLHIFSDNPAMVVMIFIIIALVYNVEITKGQNPEKIINP